MWFEICEVVQVSNKEETGDCNELNQGGSTKYPLSSAIYVHINFSFPSNEARVSQPVTNGLHAKHADLIKPSLCPACLKTFEV